MTAIDDIIIRNKEKLATRDKHANKGSYGKLLVIGGSRGMAGAAYLCSLAAFRTGIGMVKVLGPECNRVILQTALPEAMYQSTDLKPDEDMDGEAIAESIDWADIIVIGPGLSKSTEAVGLMRHIGSKTLGRALRAKALVVYDADALNIISGFIHGDGELTDTAKRLLGQCSNTVITPHIGEMARLTGRSIDYIKAHQSETAEDFSRSYGVTVVLKDAVTVVAAEHADTSGNRALAIDSGCGAMAKAGSGDVLCGFIAGITAVFKGDVADSVPAAVYLHGRAGCIAAKKTGCHSILAEDIANCAAEAMRV